MCSISVCRRISCPIVPAPAITWRQIGTKHARVVLSPPGKAPKAGLCPWEGIQGARGRRDIPAGQSCSPGGRHKRSQTRGSPSPPAPAASQAGRQGRQSRAPVPPQQPLCAGWRSPRDAGRAAPAAPGLRRTQQNRPSSLPSMLLAAAARLRSPGQWPGPRRTTPPPAAPCPPAPAQH